MTDLIKTMLLSLETELQKQVSRLNIPRTMPYYEMLTYHMGWTGEGAGSEATGKRLRPLLLLLTTAATLSSMNSERTWTDALPAAAAVELLHNFSLIHDDIQDHSNKRRGRPTVWVNWGIPQAINAGDGLFVLSNLALLDLSENFPGDTVVQATRILQNAGLELTKGQYLDISYEKRADLSVADYWPMIGGKTAALLSSCCALGAILGNADQPTLDAYQSFGHYLGLAFQVQDDMLGIWGNEETTGKSTSSDLQEGKKSLPVLAGLEKKGKFAKRWANGPIQAEEVEEVAHLLATEGALIYTQDLANQMTELALNSLRQADPQGEPGDLLISLTNQLLRRNA